MGRTMDVALIQMSCGDDIAGNVEKTEQQISAAATQGAKIICAQELFRSPYFPQVVDSKSFNQAEELNSANPTLKQMSELAGESISGGKALWQTPTDSSSKRLLGKTRSCCCAPLISHWSQRPETAFPSPFATGESTVMPV